ncbi:hypothetical protein [Thiocapsa marina]|uniref:hypothetical protein n=1 Tax=Thiocapsa marina TaxID=244573 RepID=UPI0011121C9B|nr:hypothetical protein [Thiocapsa marina]
MLREQAPLNALPDRPMAAYDPSDKLLFAHRDRVVDRLRGVVREDWVAERVIGRIQKACAGRFPSSSRVGGVLDIANPQTSAQGMIGPPALRRGPASNAFWGLCLSDEIGHTGSFRLLARPLSNRFPKALTRPRKGSPLRALFSAHYP